MRRETQIVILAASMANQHNAAWFREDRDGKWHGRAGELLSSTAPRAAELGLSDDQVNDQIAKYLNVLAIEAQIARKLKVAQ